MKPPDTPGRFGGTLDLCTSESTTRLGHIEGAEFFQVTPQMRKAVMRALVVVESLWGNTLQVARAIADGIGGGCLVVSADERPSVDDHVGLLIVGAPTHAFALPSPATRRSAAQQGAPNVPERGVLEWLDALPPARSDIPIATFDTRTVHPRLPGSAAKRAMKRLVQRGFRPIAKVESFGVHGYGGPLADGELERARAWGRSLAGDAAVRVAAT